MSDSIINCIIKDIIKTEEVSYIDDNGETKYKKYNIDYNKNIEDLFFENLSQIKKPIMIFDNGNGEILYFHEIQDFYMPKLKEMIAEKNAKSESPINETISLKEIIPTKLELTNNELDVIHSAMKNGGVIFIRNCYMVKDSLFKIMEEIKDENAVIHEYFKLILLVDYKNLIPNYFYSNCNIINRDLNILTEMKEFIIDLISSTPVNLFNRFMNNEANNSSAYYMKKLYIYFTIVIAVLTQYSYIKSRMFIIPIGFQRKDYFSILAYLYKYMNSISEDRQKEMSNLDNFYGFTYESLIKIISDVFISARMLTKEDFENINDFLLQIYENSFFMKEECLFAYDDFVLTNIDEKQYPVGQSINISEEIKESNNNINIQSSNNLGVTLSKQQMANSNNNLPKYLIPKSALLEEFNKIPNESYFCFMYGISNKMLQQKKQIYIQQFFKTICINNIYINKNEKKEILNDNSKININIIEERLKDLKQNFPDLLNTTEANPVLFKINKYNELFNPLDECLQKEIDHFNNYITKLENNIICLLNVLKGDMLLIDKYHDMIKSINKNLIPKEWSLSKYNKKEIPIKDWLDKIKKKYEFLNKWIYDGFAYVYDLSLLSNERLFLTLLPIYFQKKLPESNISSDKVKLHYKLTKYEKEEEINEEVWNEYKKNNNNNDFIFIKGLKLKGFESHKEEDREIKTFKEKDNNKGKDELLPIVVITYNVEDYQYEVLNQNQNQNESEEEEDEEEEQEINMNQEVEEEKKEENPHPSGSGPKDGDEEPEEKEENEENNENNQNNEVENDENKEKEINEEDKKEKNEEIKDNNDKIGAKFIKEEKEDEKNKEDNKKEEKVNEEGKNSEIIKGEEEKKNNENNFENIKEEENKIEGLDKIKVEETQVKTKKMVMLETMATNKNRFINKEFKDTKVTKIIRTKVRYYKKHCKLEIPFIEEQDPNTYNINDPYGYIELRFDCEKDKQEEYFLNKQLAIELDK